MSSSAAATLAQTKATAAANLTKRKEYGKKHKLVKPKSSIIDTVLFSGSVGSPASRMKEQIAAEWGGKSLEQLGEKVKEKKKANKKVWQGRMPDPADDGPAPWSVEMDAEMR